ncbi:MAG TPA: EamA family transporter [Flavobacteriaceae bacterium]|nr:EamA family transporter [Flavobacteriaceae bacterium]HBS11944.1 EamA family transporter [Flavobacteriaceae bacterium]
MTKPNKTILIVLAFFAIYVIWGSTYLLNKVVVTEVQPMFLASIRFTIAGLLIFIIAKIMKFNLSITKKQLLNSVIAGFLFLVYGNGVFIWGLKYVDSGFAALEASTQPMFILILMKVIDGKKIQTKSILGIILGIIGILLLINQDQITFQEGSIKGILIIFTSIISWSFGSLFVAKADLPANYFISTGYQMLTAGLLLGISSLALGEVWLSPLLWSSSAQISMLLLITFGSIVAFTSFNFLLKAVSPEKVATFSYVNPIIALFLGWFILNEKLTMQSIIAAFILLLGVYFINSRKRNF